MKKALLIISLILILSLVGCNIFPIDRTEDELLYTYPNIASSFSIINTRTNQVEKTVNMELPNELQLFGWCFSANENHIYFAGFNSLDTSYSVNIVDYNIEDDTVESIFKTDIKGLAAPRLGTAFIENCDSKFYLFTHSSGLYIVDAKLKESTLISSETNSEHFFYLFKDSPWTIVKKYITLNNTSFTEIEFYKKDSLISSPEFVINSNDCDGLDILDLVYSSNKNKIFFTYLLSNGRSRNIGAYFGSFNLETFEIIKGKFELPWSTNSYSISYSDEHEECYVVGEHDTVYIIDVREDSYNINGYIYLKDKTNGPTSSIVKSDDNIIYFGCSRDNKIYIYNHNKKKIVNSLFVERPYKLFLVKN